MPKPVLVDIEKDGIRATVMDKSLKVYLRNGWTVVEDGSSETGSPEPVDEPDVAADPWVYEPTDDEEE